MLKMRMAAAVRWLAETVMPIKEIARRVGYEDVAHFCRAFKNHMNCTPSVYRNKNLPRL